jgi:Na+-transporting NADH:ubiquinone oxidoreductase subunit B
MWNTGYQANLAMAEHGLARAPGWRGAVLGLVGNDPASLPANLLHGALYYLPCYLVALLAGVFWKVVFAVGRRPGVAEGVAVTAVLFPLMLPPAIPLWQVALGMSFGVVVAEELFGGTGRNFVNGALAARAFVYFGYPADNAGNAVWIAVDGTTSATPLTAVSLADPATGMAALPCTWTEAFLGTIPGSMGETSTLACLLGAALLVATGVGSWRIMAGVLLGAVVTALFFNAVGSVTNPMFSMPPQWHVVTGGFAFGLVFLATDPVTAAQTDAGRWVYGFLVGLFCVVIRVLNPGYSESMMIVLILGNVFAPLIDWFVIEANIRRRRARYGRA